MWACLNLQWSKTLDSITQPPETDSVTAHFTDSTSSTGTLLIGCDGTRSLTRSLLLHKHPSPTVTANNHHLPVRLLGASVVYPVALASKLRTLDPFFFQGGDPASNAFMFYSFLDTPSNNTRPEGQKETYECQIILSWPFRPGFKGQDEPLEVPGGGRERVKLMKWLVDGWAEPFRECVMSIPEETDVKTITLEDWVPKSGAWSNMCGRATLVGDAAHAMTMCMSLPWATCSEFCFCLDLHFFHSSIYHSLSSSQRPFPGTWRSQAADTYPQSEARLPITESPTFRSCCPRSCLC